jgi:hypothetical protein
LSAGISKPWALALAVQASVTSKAGNRRRMGEPLSSRIRNVGSPV